MSRELVSAAGGALKELCERRLHELPRLVVLMIDGTEFAGEHVIVALTTDTDPSPDS